MKRAIEKGYAQALLDICRRGNSWRIAAWMAKRDGSIAAVYPVETWSK